MGYGKNIIIVEDDPFYSELLIDQISQYEVNLTHCNTIPQFLKSNHSVDIIFLDYHMEDNSTTADLVDFLKTNGCQARIVMISGQEDGNAVLQLIQKGVRDYIIKGDSTFDEIRTVMLESGVKEKVNSLSA